MSKKPKRFQSPFLKKKQFKKAEPIGVHEPHRKSLFNIIEDNFKLGDRIQYIHRLIYIGEHYCRDEGGIQNLYNKVIKDVNQHQYEEELTGFILFYPNYFCVCIDGAEACLHKHLQYIFGSENRKKFGRVKLLVSYHHIGQRLLNNWQSYTAKPLVLYDKIDYNMGIDKTYAKLLLCVQKLYKLGLCLRPKIDDDDTDTESGYNSIPLSRYTSNEEIETSKIFRKSGHESSVRKSLFDPSSRKSVVDPIVTSLPEYEILEFLLSSRYIEDLEFYFQLFGTVARFDAPEDKVWPLEKEIVPFDVFTPATDPVVDFPEREVAVEQEEQGDDLQTEAVPTETVPTETVEQNVEV